jgi:hypothetical protein
LNLAPPGAGIPALERIIGKISIFSQAHFTPVEKSSSRFQQETQEILSLIEKIEPHQRSEKVLIPRLRGLEDSSRYWSLYMVLDHLNIVNSGVIQNIILLTQGIQPEKIVRIEDVKPNLVQDDGIVNAFQIGCCQYLDEIQQCIPTFDSHQTYNHPWFGPMTAHQWHFLMAFHMRLHRKQMALIIQGLNESN